MATHDSANMDLKEKAERLKYMFDALNKQKKKYERLKNTRGLSKPEHEQYNVVSLKLSNFNEKCKNFIRPRMNGVGKFSVEDYVSWYQDAAGATGRNLETGFRSPVGNIIRNDLLTQNLYYSNGETTGITENNEAKDQACSQDFYNEALFKDTNVTDTKVEDQKTPETNESEKVQSATPQQTSNGFTGQQGLNNEPRGPTQGPYNKAYNIAQQYTLGIDGRFPLEETSSKNPGFYRPGDISWPFPSHSPGPVNNYSNFPPFGSERGGRQDMRFNSNIQSPGFKPNDMYYGRNDIQRFYQMSNYGLTSAGEYYYNGSDPLSNRRGKLAIDPMMPPGMNYSVLGHMGTDMMQARMNGNRPMMSPGMHDRGGSAMPFPGRTRPGVVSPPIGGEMHPMSPDGFMATPRLGMDMMPSRMTPQNNFNGMRMGPGITDAHSISRLGPGMFSPTMSDMGKTPSSKIMSPNISERNFRNISSESNITFGTSYNNLGLGNVSAGNSIMNKGNTMGTKAGEFDSTNAQFNMGPDFFMNQSYDKQVYSRQAFPQIQNNPVKSPTSYAASKTINPRTSGSFKDGLFSNFFKDSLKTEPSRDIVEPDEDQLLDIFNSSSNKPMIEKDIPTKRKYVKKQQKEPRENSKDKKEKQTKGDFYNDASSGNFSKGTNSNLVDNVGDSSNGANLNSATANSEEFSFGLTRSVLGPSSHYGADQGFGAIFSNPNSTSFENKEMDIFTFNDTTNLLDYTRPSADPVLNSLPARGLGKSINIENSLENDFFNDRSNKTFNEDLVSMNNGNTVRPNNQGQTSFETPLNGIINGVSLTGSSTVSSGIHYTSEQTDSLGIKRKYSGVDLSEIRRKDVKDIFDYKTIDVCQAARDFVFLHVDSLLHEVVTLACEMANSRPQNCITFNDIKLIFKNLGKLNDILGDTLIVHEKQDDKLPSSINVLSRASSLGDSVLEEGNIKPSLDFTEHNKILELIENDKDNL